MAIIDLSHLTKGLLADSSQHGPGSTVSETPGYRGPGSESEATANVPVGMVTDPDDAPQADYRPLVEGDSD